MFARRLVFKKWFHKNEETDVLNTTIDQESIQTLQDLLEENIEDNTNLPTEATHYTVINLRISSNTSKRMEPSPTC